MRCSFRSGADANHGLISWFPAEESRLFRRLQFVGKKIIVGISGVAELFGLLARLRSLGARRQVLGLREGFNCFGSQIPITGT
jgi:hypothetical protein